MIYDFPVGVKSGSNEVFLKADPGERLVHVDLSEALGHVKNEGPMIGQLIAEAAEDFFLELNKFIQSRGDFLSLIHM